MKKVWMIAYTRYSYDARVRREASTLSSHGKKVSILTLKEGSKSRCYKDGDVNVLEVDLSKYYGKSNFAYIISYTVFSLLCFVKLTKQLVNGDIDYIHIHNMPNSLIFSAFLPWIFGKKIVLDIHDTMIETYLSKYEDRQFQFRLMYLLLYIEEYLSCLMASKIICVNHRQMEVVAGRGVPRSKITIVLNVPDPSIFSASEKTNTLRRPGDPFRLVYHGTLSRRLGVDLALKAIILLKPEIPELQFNILGVGDALSDLKNICNENNINGMVKFHEPVPVGQLPALLNEMDLEIVPSRKNTATQLMLPVKLLECVSIGLPVVAPRLKAIEYYFDDKMLYYFDAGSIDSLAQAILLAYRNDTERAEKALAANKFMEKYGWNSHKNQLLDIYDNFSD